MNWPASIPTATASVTPDFPGKTVLTGHLSAGMKVRRAVLGDAHVDRSLANQTDFDADFDEYIAAINAIEHYWLRVVERSPAL